MRRCGSSTRRSQQISRRYRQRRSRSLGCRTGPLESSSRARPSPPRPPRPRRRPPTSTLRVPGEGIGQISSGCGVAPPRLATEVCRAPTTRSATGTPRRRRACPRTVGRSTSSTRGWPPRRSSQRCASSGPIPPPTASTRMIPTRSGTRMRASSTSSLSAACCRNSLR